MSAPHFLCQQVSWFPGEHIRFYGVHPLEVIDMSWDDVCNVFDGIYINWDPRLFKHKLTFHG